MKKTTVIVLTLFASVATANQWGRCSDPGINELIKKMGPAGRYASCPEWDQARREWNARRDVTSLPIPMIEYRARLQSGERR